MGASRLFKSFYMEGKVSIFSQGMISVGITCTLKLESDNLCEELSIVACCISFYLVLYGYLLVVAVAGKMGD